MHNRTVRRGAQADAGGRQDRPAPGGDQVVGRAVGDVQPWRAATRLSIESRRACKLQSFSDNLGAVVSSFGLDVRELQHRCAGRTLLVRDGAENRRKASAGKVWSHPVGDVAADGAGFATGDRARPGSRNYLLAMARCDAEGHVANTPVQERHDQANGAAAKIRVALGVFGEHRAHAWKGETLAFSEEGQILVVSYLDGGGRKKLVEEHGDRVCGHAIMVPQRDGRGCARPCLLRSDVPQSLLEA